MILTEYNEQNHIENEKEISREEGREEFAELTRRMIEDGRTEELLKATEDEEYRKRLFLEYSI